MSSLQSIAKLRPGTMFRLPSDAFMRVENHFGSDGKAYAVNLENGCVVEFEVFDKVIVLDTEENKGGKE